MDFESWFKETGYSEYDQDMLKDAWDAALEAAAKHVFDCEGTTFNLEHDLKA